MKKILLLLVFLFPFVAKSQMLGGSISVDQNQYGQVQLNMQLIHEDWVPMPQNIYIEKWAMDSNGLYVFDENVYLQKNTQWSYVQSGFEYTKYTSSNLSIDSNKYRYVYQYQHFPYLVNVPSYIQLSLTTDYWHIPNNSTPEFVNIPNLFVNSNNSYLVTPLVGPYNVINNSTGDSIYVHQIDIQEHINGFFVSYDQTLLDMTLNNDSMYFQAPSYNGMYGIAIQIDTYSDTTLLNTQRSQWAFVVGDYSFMSISEYAINNNLTFEVYDWNGKLIEDVNSTGYYIIRYSDGTYDKVFLNKQ